MIVKNIIWAKDYDEIKKKFKYVDEVMRWNIQICGLGRLLWAIIQICK